MGIIGPLFRRENRKSQGKKKKKQPPTPSFVMSSGNGKKKKSRNVRRERVRARREARSKGPGAANHIAQRKKLNLRGDGPRRKAEERAPVLPTCESKECLNHGKEQVIGVFQFVAPHDTPQRCKNIAIRFLGGFYDEKSADAYIDELYKLDPDFDIHKIDLGHWIVLPPPPKQYASIKMEYQQEKLKEFMEEHYRKIDKGKRHMERRITEGRKNAKKQKKARRKMDKENEKGKEKEEDDRDGNDTEAPQVLCDAEPRRETATDDLPAETRNGDPPGSVVSDLGGTSGDFPGLGVPDAVSGSGSALRDDAANTPGPPVTPAPGAAVDAASGHVQ